MTNLNFLSLLYVIYLYSDTVSHFIFLFGRAWFNLIINYSMHFYNPIHSYHHLSHTFFVFDMCLVETILAFMCLYSNTVLILSFLYPTVVHFSYHYLSIFHLHSYFPICTLECLPLFNSSFQRRTLKKFTSVNRSTKLAALACRLY